MFIDYILKKKKEKEIWIVVVKTFLISVQFLLRGCMLVYHSISIVCLICLLFIFLDLICFNNWIFFFSYYYFLRISWICNIFSAHSFFFFFATLHQLFCAAFASVYSPLSLRLSRSFIRLFMLHSHSHWFRLIKLQLILLCCALILHFTLTFSLLVFIFVAAAVAVIVAVAVAVAASAIIINIDYRQLSSTKERESRQCALSSSGSFALLLHIALSLSLSLLL